MKTIERNSGRERALVERKLQRDIGKAIGDWQMIEEGDRILVAVSGGKDSLCMLHFLKHFQSVAPIRFEILAVNLDQKQPGFPADVLPRLFQEWDVPFHVETQDTYSIVLEKTEPGKTFCAVCSRLRRGILYNVARKFQCNKIALGHHRDDVLQTFLMNLFFSGKLGSMPPIYKTESDDLAVIRPLYSVSESLIKEYVNAMGWPIIPCNLCGSQEGLKRKELATMLEQWSERFPEVKNSIFAALHNPHVDELYARDLWKNPNIAIRR